MQNSLPASRLASLRQEAYNATVSSIVRVHEELMILRVRPDFGVPPHKAGQYTALGLGYWEPRCEGCQREHLKPGQEGKLVKRAYSLSSSPLGANGELLRPEDEDFLEFYIVLVREAERAPALTPRMFRLSEGDRIFVGRKITGRYTLDPVQPGQNVLFMATGTGEGPHNKMILDLMRRGHTGLIASVVCVRYQRDLAYLAMHHKLMERVPDYRYIALTTRESGNRDRKMYIQDLICSGQLEAKLGRPLDPACTHIFLCGNPQMIGVPRRNKDGTYSYPKPRGVIEILESRGFKTNRPRDPGNIHFEEYW